MSKNKNPGNNKVYTSNIRHLKMPERLWKLVSKASKNNRSIRDYIINLIENDLIKRKMIKKSEKKNILKILNLNNCLIKKVLSF